jgi:predicted dinucleotide-binding enzyme
VGNAVFGQHYRDFSDVRRFVTMLRCAYQEDDRMKIAIFGSDPRAVAIGQLLVDAGYDVRFGDSGGIEPAEAAAEQAGAVADTPYNDAAVCEMLIFAGPRDQMDDLLAQAGQISAQTIVVDAMEGGLGDAADGSLQLARKLDSRRVVRASISLPQVGANVLYCSDDADAMTKVDEVFRSAGCVTTDRGPLVNAAAIEAPPEPTGATSFETLKAANARSSELLASGK